MELEARSDLDEKVTERLQEIRDMKDVVAKDMAWVNSNKTEAATKKVEDFEEWWKKKVAQQESLPLHEAPAFLANEVTEKLASLHSAWDKLKKTKKPKEKKEDKKADAKDKKADVSKDKKAEDKAEEPELSNDIEVLEKDLAALREKKSAAVENEEYDEANALKVQEQKMVKHIEKLKSEKSEL